MNQEHEFQDEVECAHEGCSCMFVPDEGFEHEGNLYCSQGCAEGTGCQHEKCDCAMSH